MDGWMECFYLLDLVPHVRRRELAGAGRSHREGRADADTASVSWDAIANVTGGCPPAVLHWRQCHLSTGIYRSASGG